MFDPASAGIGDRQLVFLRILSADTNALRRDPSTTRGKDKLETSKVGEEMIENRYLVTVEKDRSSPPSTASKLTKPCLVSQSPGSKMG